MSEIISGVSEIRRLGECLRGGEFIESPFDLPVEEERRGDPDQSDDDRNFADGENICVSLEPALPNGKKDVSKVPFEPRFSYFLDGSLRTKYLGEYMEGERNFPILASEVSCAVIKRDASSLQPHRLERKFAFIVPHKKTGLISDSLYEKLEELDQSWRKEGSIFGIEFLMREREEMRDVRYSMQGKARDVMHNLEHDVAKSIDLEEDWLVMDGAIRKEEFLELDNTVGLAKSFSRKPLFDLGDGRPIMITKYLSRVRDGERSAVFRKEGEKRVIFWYVRLRTYPPMEPLGGLVKVDFKFDGETLSEAQVRLIDEISAEIYAHRSPSVYPQPRWPSTIYPIRMAELMMRTAFLNDEIVGHYGRELKRAIGGVTS